MPAGSIGPEQGPDLRDRRAALVGIVQERIMPSEASLAFHVEHPCRADQKRRRRQGSSLPFHGARRMPAGSIGPGQGPDLQDWRAARKRSVKRWYPSVPDL